MRTHLPALLVLLLCAGAAPLAEAVAAPAAPRVKGYATGRKGAAMRKTIYKGKNANARNFPFQVYVRVFLEDGSKEFCGGAIISPHHILTARHCVDMANAEKVCTIAGHENRFHRDTLKFTVVRQHFYPKTRKEKVEADIAILMVDRPMSLGRTVQQIRLHPQTEVPTNTTCSISGWGKTDDEDDDSNIMKHAKVPLVSKELCRKSYPEDDPDDLLCAGFYETGGADACKGDSGGPLVCRSFLMGIVKAGKGCGLPHYPGTYTDVRYYWNWIKKTIGEDMKKPFNGTLRKEKMC